MFEVINFTIVYFFVHKNSFKYKKLLKNFIAANRSSRNCLILYFGDFNNFPNKFQKFTKTVSKKLLTIRHKLRWKKCFLYYYLNIKTGILIQKIQIFVAKNLRVKRKILFEKNWTDVSTFLKLLFLLLILH